MNFIQRIFYRYKAKNRPFKLTKAGWVFILYTIGVGAGAINTGNNLLYLIFGVFLGLILSSGVLSDLTLWHIDVVLEFPEHAVAGRSNLINVSVANRKKWFPSVSLTIEVVGELRGENVPLKKYIPVAFPGEEIKTHMNFFPQKRGLFEAKYLKLTTQFPFGLLIKWWRFPITINSKSLVDSKVLAVYPMPFNELIELSSSSQTGNFQENQSDQKGDGALVHGVREFQESDNPRRIHWKASAKRSFNPNTPGGSWLIKEMEADEKNHLILYWPIIQDLKRLNDFEFEDLIRFSAGLINQLEDEGREVKLIVKSKDSGLKTIRNPNLFLALTEKTQSLPPTLSRFMVDFRDRDDKSQTRIRLLEEFISRERKAA